MKTKEFIEKVEALGLLVHDGICYLEVEDTEGEDVVDILKTKRWVYDCEHVGFESLHEVKQTELMEIVTEYVTTQSKDREEEKSYRLRLSAPILQSDEYVYLTHIFTKDHYQLGSDSINDSTWKTIFTESEIAAMDITGFEKEEVK